MKNLASIGDLSRLYHTRLSNVSTKSKIDTLSYEATTGIKKDIATHLNGNTALANQLEHRLNLLGTYKSNTIEIDGVLSAMQLAMQTIQDSIADLGPNLISEANLSSDQQVDIRTSQAKEHLSTIIRALNTTSGGKSLFAGTRTDALPLPSVDTLIGAVANQVTGLNSLTDIKSSISSWFDSQNGGGGYTDTVYQGNNLPAHKVPVSERRAINITTNANSPAIKEILKGLSLYAMAGSSQALQDRNLQRGLLIAAGETLTFGKDLLTAERARIGFSEETLKKETAQNAAETSALSITKNNLISAEPFEAALSLKEMESTLNNLYTLTARLSSLKLTDYLR